MGNELIREYFEYNGYHHALSVLLPESGHPEERQFDRRFLASELRVQEDERSRSVPLIYSLVRGIHTQGPPQGAVDSESRRGQPTSSEQASESLDTGAGNAARAAASSSASLGDQPPPMV